VTKPAPPLTYGWTPPLSPVVPQPTRRGRKVSGGQLPAGTMIVAVAAAVVAGIALARAPVAAPPQTAPASIPSAPPVPSAAAVAAAKKEACDAWKGASNAMVAQRDPFVSSPPEWTNPVTIGALTQAEAGIVIQVEYLRQHLPADAPADVAGPIGEYIAASLDMAAGDGQHQSESVANAAADRGRAAAAKIRAACGL
jgi:hypothetical protein